jgi:hypothetical protein
MTQIVLFLNFGKNKHTTRRELQVSPQYHWPKASTSQFDNIMGLKDPQFQIWQFLTLIKLSGNCYKGYTTWQEAVEQEQDEIFVVLPLLLTIIAAVLYFILV